MHDYEGDWIIDTPYILCYNIKINKKIKRELWIN